ncbi:RNA 2',3'-cyclic phosphodiesterase [Solibacillus sp. FSL R5-0691]|uniref:RNA 2',3'-cyclic phosphodiesterase n=1 Tax=Solibacillus sp. FSL R5-0691 TaxID=2921653 RepID=UPI0030CE0F40
MERVAHYFWAVRIPDEIKQTMYEELNRIKPVFQFKRWVDLNDYHITLAFLGAVNPQQLSSVIESVGESIKIQKAFMLDIKGLGVFGAEKSPRIFWGAVSEADALYEIQAIVHQTCLAEGFKLETRPYHPHITFARKWGANEDFLVDYLVTQNPFKEKHLSFKVNEIVLYKSNIENTPKYEPIASIYLEE